MFTHLQVHSAYSLLYGTRHIEDIVRTAAQEGYKALALTDINNLYGVHRFLDACKNHGIRPIIGAEIRKENERVVLLCINHAGFSNLCMLITERMRNNLFKLEEQLKRFHEGTVMITDSETVIRECAGKIEHLYAMITPFSRGIQWIANKSGIPLIATGDVTFLSSNEIKIHRVLRAIANQTTVSRIKDDEGSPANAVLFPPGKARDIFSDFPEAVLNNEKVSETCTFDTIFRGFIFPKCPSSFSTDKKTPEEILRELTLAGAEERYGEIGEGVLNRIEYELGIINRKGFATYFLTVTNIVRMTGRTCGRGSAAASIVSYCLKITNVDPIAYNLYFERFLNDNRSDPPDIDVDFAWDERDAIIAAVMKQYGEAYSARVCNHNHFQERGALREVARVYGMPDNETTAFEKRASHGKTESDSVWNEILSIAKSIDGLPRHLGVHSGGIVLTPEPIATYVPIETSAMGVPVVTWEKDGTEEAGLVKIDLLGNRSLAVIRDSLANLKENNILFDQSRWMPQEDQDTVDLLSRGDSMGVFYVESPAMRQLQKKTRKGDFDHLVIHSSIIRPAANKYINEYVRRLNGEPYKPLHPVLEKILDETYGIMVYQEDVTKVAIAIAGFSDADGDGLRKIMSKKNKEIKLAHYKAMFFEGAKKNGVDNEIIENIWNMILSFDGYSFCKPHSASYAMVSFQSAYCKAHFPAEFMAAVISNQGGYYTTEAYISEAKRLGLSLLPPDVNMSEFRYSGKGKTIRVGLMAISGLHHKTAEAIIENKQKGYYIDLEDFVQRITLQEEDAEALVASGAVESISGDRNRPEQLWSLLQCTAMIKRETHNDLFENREVIKNNHNEYKRFKNIEEEEIKRGEYKRLGFLCDRHALWFWRNRIRLISHVSAKEMHRYINRKIKMIGWLVTSKEVITMQEKLMVFISFEDETDIFETVFFPDSYTRYYHLLDVRAPFVIVGKVDDDFGAISLHVLHIEKLLS